MKILVTGAAGFIGSHLCEALLARGDEVIALDNYSDYYSPERKHANVESFQNHPHCCFYKEDIRNEEKVQQIFRQHQTDAVAHLAGYGAVRYSIGRAKLYTEVNIMGSIHILEAARLYGTRNFVFASTSSVYGMTDRIPFTEEDTCGEPLAPYPASKRAIELMGHTYHHLHQLNFTALRFFNVYGPRGRPDMMPFIVTDRIAKQEEIILFNAGQMHRDWTYVDDIVNGVVAALDNPFGYEVLNLGRGEPVLMADFIKIIEGLVGRQAILTVQPAPPSEPKITFAGIDKARRLLNYDPQTPVVEGLTRLWKWYQRQTANGITG